MPKLTDRLKKQLCEFNTDEVMNTRIGVNIPKLERFNPDELFFTSDVKMVNINADEMRNELHINNGNTQLSLLLSYVYFLTHCMTQKQLKAENVDVRPNVIIVGINPGDAIPFLMELFPMLNYIFVYNSTDANTMRRLFDDSENSDRKLAGYFEALNEGIKLPTSFHKNRNEYKTNYRFASIKHFMDLLKSMDSNEYNAMHGAIKPDIFELNERYGNMKGELTVDDLIPSNERPVYFISNHYSVVRDVLAEENNLILDDLIIQVYWMRVLKSTYSMIRYKPLNPERTLSDNVRNKLKYLASNDESAGQYCHLPVGYMFRIPKNPRQIESCFLITNEYRKTMRIYHRDMRTLIKYHNSYTRKVVLYEDIFVRMINNDTVSIPYSRLNEKLLGDIMTNTRYGVSSDNRHHYHISNNWDDTAAIYIIMCYLNKLGKTIPVSEQEYLRELNINVRSVGNKSAGNGSAGNRETVDIKLIMMVLIRALLILGYEKETYGHVTQRFIPH